MILVTSAAGNTGRVIVKTLVEAGLDVLATDINSKVKELPGIKKAMVGDLTDRSFIEAIMSVADMVVYVPPLFSAEESLIGKRMVDEAIKQDIEPFLFVSVIHPILTSLVQHTAKREVEEYLIYQGMKTQCNYTILQPMHYMHNFDPKMVSKTREYRIFYNVDSRVGYIATEDVSEVIVKIIADPLKHNKATYELVGTQAYSPNELVKIYNQLTGQAAVTTYIEVEDFLNQIGVKDLYFREGFAQLAHPYSKWGLDGNTNVLRWLLGHDPKSFEDYIIEKLNDK